MKKNTKFIIILLLTLTFLPTSNVDALISSTREHDPVILSGSDVSVFSNLNPSQLVGFKFLNNAWTQIPIQIDERELLDIVSPYGAQAGVYTGTYPASASNPKVLYYSDSATIGADSNGLFDADDELVFMAVDTGERSYKTFPSGIIANSCQEITIQDPLSSDVSYVYICQNDGSLVQDAGIDYVDYTSNVMGTAGFPQNENFFNTEDTTITTSEYAWHFAAEWLSDEFKIAGGTLDILDRHQVMADAGGTPNCNLNTYEFSERTNAYVTVKDGSVRVIRSYLGSNSGVNTLRTHFFYKGRHDMFNDLHVHPFSVVVTLYDAYDYSPAAIGMTYLNDQQPSTASRVTIDGIDDVLVQNPQALLWEEVRGATDVVSIIHSTETNGTALEVSFVPYYQDSTSFPEYNCPNTGDGQSLAMSGMGAVMAIGICTDILHGNCDTSEFRTIKNTRITYVDQGASIADGITAQYAMKNDNPLNISTSLFTLQSSRKGGSKRISKERLAQMFGSQSFQSSQINRENTCSINYTRLIKFGIRGEDVKQVQACMNTLGYTTGLIDGIYGPLTYAGITNYQRAHNLKVDGIVGPETSGELNEN